MHKGVTKGVCMLGGIFCYEESLFQLCKSFEMSIGVIHKVRTHGEGGGVSADAHCVHGGGGATRVRFWYPCVNKKTRIKGCF